MYGSDNYINVLYSNGILNTIQEPTRVELYGNNIVATCLYHINIKYITDSFISFLLDEKLQMQITSGQD